MVSKKNDTSWIASGLRAGAVLGATAFEVEAAAEPATVAADVDTTVPSDAALGGSTDTRDSGVIGSEAMLDPA